jgi:CubicO group peptidase (beta-lactamase class C family)
MRIVSLLTACMLMIWCPCALSDDRADAVSPVSESAATAAPRLTSADLETWLDGFLPFALAKNDIAGMVVMVVKDGEVLLQKGYGYADVAAKAPMDPERSIVEVASVTKTFTWTAVMQLVEQGKLDLDRDINEYLDFKIPDAFGKPITMRHLMTHTPGFEERIKSYLTEDSPQALGAYLRVVPAPTRIGPPGELQAYSNYGVLVAGYIVERISGEPFADYVERHILAPLGMQHSTMLRPVPKQLQPMLAKNYSVASSAEPIPPSKIDELVADPAGSLVSTAADMSRFMRAHLQGGTFGGYQMLKPETTKLMHAPAFTPMPGAIGTALGFFGGDFNGHRTILHDGDGSGNHADMQLLIDDGVGFLAVMNSDGPGGFIGASYTLRASLFRHFMDRYFPGTPEPQEPTTATAKEHAQLVAGEYEMSRRPSGDFFEAFYLATRIAIKANDDGTIETPSLLNFALGRPQTWREVGPFSWREVGGNARLNMKVEDERVITWLPRDASTFQLTPAPFLLSRALNVPLIFTAIGILIGTTLLWPVAAIVRRRYGRALELEGRALQAHRWTRFASLAAVFFLLGWMAVLMAVATGIAGFDDALDPWIRVVQLIGLACVAGAAVAVWNAYVTCTGRRTAWAKACSVLVAFALVDLVWFAFAFNLISAGLNY